MQKSTLFFIMLTIGQSCYGSMMQQYASPANNNASLDAFIDNKNRDHYHPQAASRFIEESYISPEMQWSVFSLLQSSGMTINTVTGAVQNFPSIEFILPRIGQLLQQPIYKAQQDAAKNALHAMIEAIDIALYVASLESAYQDQRYIMYQDVNANLTASLKSSRQDVQNMINAVNNATLLDQPAQQSSYFSWLPSFGSDNSKQPIMISGESIPVAQNSATVTIPGSLMPTIIKTNDYKEKPDAIQAANLLFKQCFIAQQHHLKDSYRINRIRVNLRGSINANNYIFNNFPNIYDPNSNTYPICEIAKSIVPAGQFRGDLQSQPSPEQLQAHHLLLHIRQAIQTALYIANDKSSYNFGYLLPDLVKSNLGRIVTQLTSYDAQLSALCKEPQYGATEEDTYRDDQLAMITKVAAGVVATAIVGGAMYAYAPSAASFIANKASGYLPGWLGGGSVQPEAAPVAGPVQADGTQPVAAPAQAAGSSWLPSWLGGTPAPANDPNQPTTAQTVTKYAGQAMQYGSKIAQVGSAVALTANIVNGLDKSGMVGAPGTLNAMTGGYGDTVVKGAQSLGAGAALLGGTAAAVGGAANALVNMNDIFGVVGAMNATSGATGALKNAAGYVATAAGSMMAGSQPAQQAAPAPSQAQKIYDGFVKIINTSVSKGADPLPAVAQGINHVLTNKITDTNTIQVVLQQLQKDTAQNPELSNGLGQMMQAIAG